MEIPPDCEINKKIDYEKCRECRLKKCPLRQGTIDTWEKLINDQWYENMREEWYESMRDEIDDFKKTR